MNSVNGVQQKGPGCARPYGRTAISAVLQFVYWSFSQHPHLQFKNTHWLETATKLTCPLSVWDFVWPCCVCMCVYIKCVSSLSLFETSSPKKWTLTLGCVALCVCEQRMCVCVCRFYKQVDRQHVCRDTGHVSLLENVFFVFTSPWVKLCLSTERLQYRQEPWHWHRHTELYHVNCV